MADLRQRLVGMGNMAQYLELIGSQAHISVGIISLKCLDLPLKWQHHGNICVGRICASRRSHLTAHTHIYLSCALQPCWMQSAVSLRRFLCVRLFGKRTGGIGRPCRSKTNPVPQAGKARNFFEHLRQKEGREREGAKKEREKAKQEQRVSSSRCCFAQW